MGRNAAKRGLISIAFALIALTACTPYNGAGPSGADSSAQVAEADKNAAQEVIGLINGLGTITLDSGDAISAAEAKYKALTRTQKALVTNHDALTSARSTYDNLKRDEETKDDPTRTIRLSDLNGDWASEWYEWKIANIGGATAVLYWVYNGKTGRQTMGQLITKVDKSSYLVGYNNKLRVMEAKLYEYSGFDNKYLNISLTKTEDGIHIYWGNEKFSRE